MTAISLKQLAEGKADGIQKATYFTVDPDALVIEEGWNGRDEGDDLTAYRGRMKAAMKAGAHFPPISVEVVDGEMIVRDGHSRTINARELKAEGHPITLKAEQVRGDESEMIFHMIGTALGRPLNPLEQGRQFKRLRAYGLDIVRIAERLGMHRSTIENGLELAEAPVAVQKLVADHKVSASTALKTIRKEGKKAATKTLTEAVQTAAKAGKKKATGKHMPKLDVQPMPRETAGSGVHVPPGATAEFSQVGDVSAAVVTPSSIYIGAQTVTVASVVALLLDLAQVHPSDSIAIGVLRERAGRMINGA